MTGRSRTEAAKKKRATRRAAPAKLAPAPDVRFALPKKHLGVLAEDQRAMVLDHVRAVCEVPTAPYAEDGQVELVRSFVAERPALSLVEDEWANLLVTYDPPRTNGSKVARRSRREPVFALSAHLDHPGFLYAGRRKGVHRATFHGGVPLKWFGGAPVRFFDLASGEPCATATVRNAKYDRKKDLVCELSNFRGRVRRGMFGMWDVTPGRMRGSRLHARVCDDLMGAAAMLSTLELLIAERHDRPVLAIFTRAEETGFMGCLGLLRSKALGSPVAVIGLECSPKRATAKVGQGPVIRVGDRGAIFDPGLTHHLQAAAARVQARIPAFRYQRALMDGGRCESSAYNLYGVRAGAACLALGNYHNVGAKETIAPEYVDWNDHEGMVALLVQAARDWGRGTAEDGMSGALDRIWERESPRLAKSAARLGARPVE